MLFWIRPEFGAVLVEPCLAHTGCAYGPMVVKTVVRLVWSWLPS